MADSDLCDEERILDWMTSRLRAEDAVTADDGSEVYVAYAVPRLDFPDGYDGKMRAGIEDNATGGAVGWTQTFPPPPGGWNGAPDRVEDWIGGLRLDSGWTPV